MLIKITSLLKIRKIESSQHKTSEYIITLYYFSGINNQRNKVFIYIKRKIHVVDDLRVKMLINNDFIKFKKIIINVFKKKIYITNYKTFIIIITRQRDQFIKKRIHVVSTIKISFHNKKLMLIAEIHSLSKNHNYMFELIKQTNVIFFAHLMNNKIFIIFIKNNSNY